MTIPTTAYEIARRFGSDAEINDLELAILRHMEHHRQLAITAEREACAKIADAYVEKAWAATDIAADIRART